jgi:hypothetical protein
MAKFQWVFENQGTYRYRSIIRYCSIDLLLQNKLAIARSIAIAPFASR